MLYFLNFNYERLIFPVNFPLYQQIIQDTSVLNISIAEMQIYGIIFSFLGNTFFAFSTWSFLLEKAIFLLRTLVIKSGIHIFFYYYFSWFLFKNFVCKVEYPRFLFNTCIDFLLSFNKQAATCTQHGKNNEQAVLK